MTGLEASAEVFKASFRRLFSASRLTSVDLLFRAAFAQELTVYLV